MTLLVTTGSPAQVGDKSNPAIYHIRQGVSDCWIIKGETAVMIDAGIMKKEKSLVRQLSRLPFTKEEISLIVLTHGHFDHIGLAGKIRELTGAKILIHESDRPMLEEGRFIVPQGITGWGRFGRKVLMPIMKSLGSGLPKIKADIVMDNNPLSLEEYGISGSVIYTPGHTMGSISVVLDNGKAFVGCMAQNRLPFTLRPQLPIFADYPELFPNSWAKLQAAGAKEFYPGHGKAFKLKQMKLPPGTHDP